MLLAAHKHGGPVRPWHAYTEAQITRSLELEEILVDTRAGTLELAWRKMFRYPFIAHQKRQARVIQRKTSRGRPLSAFTTPTAR